MIANILPSNIISPKYISTTQWQFDFLLILPLSPKKMHQFTSFKKLHGWIINKKKKKITWMTFSQEKIKSRLKKLEKASKLSLFWCLWTRHSHTIFCSHINRWKSYYQVLQRYIYLHGKYHLHILSSMKHQYRTSNYRSLQRCILLCTEKSKGLSLLLLFFFLYFIHLSLFHLCLCMCTLEIIIIQLVKVVTYSSRRKKIIIIIIQIDTQQHGHNQGVITDTQNQKQKANNMPWVIVSIIVTVS